tara:strand:+ start:964 stop:1671 length:708 start_codon:yes stop_codon:yes gene_type:complete
MKKFQSKFKVLNEFQASHTKQPLGADYSFNYATDKGIMLYVHDPKLESSISFKSFLKDFSISQTIKNEDSEQIDGGVLRDLVGVGIVYNFTLQVPALSVNDARFNIARFEELDRMISNNFGIVGSVAVEAERVRYVLLANLVHNGKYTKKHEITTEKHILEYGLPCYFYSSNYTIDTEMGYFEYKNKLWPKAYDIKFSLITKTATNNGNKVGRGFNYKGELPFGASDSWPFGVKS